MKIEESKYRENKDSKVRCNKKLIIEEDYEDSSKKSKKEI